MKKKIIISILSIIIVIAAISGVYYLLNRQDKDTTLTIVEKKWIETNKNKLIDLKILNNIAILNYEGDGVFFDFLESLEKLTGLEFNKVSYQYGETSNSDYSFKVSNNVTKNDILIYKDNYVLLSKENIKYTSLDQIKDLTIGVLNDNLKEVDTYITSQEISYKTYNNISELLTEINKENSSINAIVLPKLIYISNLDKDSELKINYNITEMNDNYILSLGSNDRLNNILKKYYQKWYNDSYEIAFAKHFTNTYFTTKEIDEQSKVKFRSKRYIYGFINNSPFDKNSDNRLTGINNTIIKEFSKLTNVEIIYKEYSNFQKLSQEFNNNNIDIFMDYYRPINYKMDVFKTVSIHDEQIVIASHLNNNTIINSINSLKDKEVLTVDSTKIAEQLKSLGTKVKAYPNIESLIKSTNKNTLIAIDYYTYNYYFKTKLEDYKIDYQYHLNNDYNYIVRDIKENEIFADFLNYYLGYINEQPIINKGYLSSLNNKPTISTIRNLLLIIVGLVLIISAIYAGRKIKLKSKKTVNMKKEDKLKYIDMLTSLKNRNYLNDNIEKWDNSEVYPQTIIIVDLNNIAYINDNYGHQEGDNIIKEAANILITNQMPNSDIIRTNGNEFLIYLVSYDEKQIVAYIRKLAKEFKELSHNFGAAIGYSIVNDAIKTIDDAINEATLDMRNNKEELNN